MKKLMTWIEGVNVMITLRRLILVLLLAATPVLATTRYVAQTAGTFTGGTACNGHTAITPSTWNSTSEAAGDISYICGTIIGSAGSGPLLTFGWSGASGNLITMLFDTGAIIEAPWWASEAINVNGKSYITVNGQNTGSILATANGYPSATCPGGTCTFQESTGNCIVSSGGTNYTVENLSCGPMYVHYCPSGDEASCPDEGGSNTGGIWTANTTNYIATGNTCQGGWACMGFTVSANYSGGTPITFTNNTIFNSNIGIEVSVNNGDTVSGMTISGNFIHDGSNWTDMNNGNHHDGMHIFCNGTSSVVNNFQVTNNFIYGNWGNGINAFIFIEGGGNVTSNYPGVLVANNILEYDTPTSIPNQAGNGLISISGSNNAVVANNICNGDSCNNMYEDTNEHFNNNLVMNGELCQCHYSNNISAASWDYNVYYGLTAWDGSAGSFSAWKTTCTSNLGVTCDANSVSGTNPNLTGPVTIIPVASPLNSNYRPTASSAVLINTGINLTSLGYALLDSDYANSPRPTSGTWTKGAYNYGNPSPSNPTQISPVIVSGNVRLSGKVVTP